MLNEKDIQEKFDKYIEAYTKLSIDDKKKEIIEKLRNIISSYELVNRNLGRQHDLLINRELIDSGMAKISYFTPSEFKKGEV